MRNPSHDERISAFLDDALPEGERAAFEAELRNNSELKQQVVELRRLRADVALLPRYSVSEGFAQRVVAAALVAKANENAIISPAAKSKPMRLKTLGRGVVTGLAIAASIAILMISLPWLNLGGNDPVKVAVTNKNQNQPTIGTENNAVAAESKPYEIVWSSLPGKDEAMVIRIRAPKDFAAGKALRSALAEQGIEKKGASDTSTVAARVGKAYRDSVTSKDTATASDALYLEISKDELDEALAAIATPEHKVEFVPSQLVAVSRSPDSQVPLAAGEKPAQIGLAAPSVEFMQELNPRRFNLPKEAPKSNGPVAPHSTDGKAKVRVLILVEAVE